MSAKVALLTGASKRIGACCAKFLHARGCKIIIHYHHGLSAAQQLTLELNALRQDSAVLMQADLLDMQALQKLALDANSVWGRVDILFNNASLFYPEAIADVTESSWEAFMGSNLKAPFFLTKALISILRERHGCVVNMVDIHAEKGLLGYPVYSIAKAGLEATTRILAKELAPEIRVNGISPGAILWPEHNSSSQEQQEILQRVALQRCGTPEDIAKALCFLCFDADYMTGQILKVDGGRTLFV